MLEELRLESWCAIQGGARPLIGKDVLVSPPQKGVGPLVKGAWASPTGSIASLALESGSSIQKGLEHILPQRVAVLGGGCGGGSVIMEPGPGQLMRGIVGGMVTRQTLVLGAGDDFSCPDNTGGPGGHPLLGTYCSGVGTGMAATVGGMTTKQILGGGGGGGGGGDFTSANNTGGPGGGSSSSWGLLRGAAQRPEPNFFLSPNWPILLSPISSPWVGGAWRLTVRGPGTAILLNPISSPWVDWRRLRVRGPGTLGCPPHPVSLWVQHARGIEQQQQQQQQHSGRRRRPDDAPSRRSCRDGPLLWLPLW